LHARTYGSGAGALHAASVSALLSRETLRVPKHFDFVLFKIDVKTLFALFVFYVFFLAFSLLPGRFLCARYVFMLANGFFFRFRIFHFSSLLTASFSFGRKKMSKSVFFLFYFFFLSVSVSFCLFSRSSKPCTFFWYI